MSGPSLQLMVSAPPDDSRLFAFACLNGIRRLVLVAVVFLLPVSHVIDLGGKPVNFAFADLFLPLGCFFLVWRSLTTGLRLPRLVCFALGVAVIALSSLVNVETALSFRTPASLVVEAVKVLTLWTYFYLLVNAVDDRRDLRLLFRTWIISSTGVALSGIAGSLFYLVTRIENRFSLQYRAQGTFEDSNLFATHLLLGLFLILAFRRLAETSPLWHWITLALHLLGILMSASRGGLLALAAGVLMFWFLRNPFRGILAGLALTVSMAVVVGLLPHRDELLASNPITARLATTTLDLDDGEAQERLGLWKRAAAYFAQSPVLGVGRGNYGSKEPGSDKPATQAHNTYLNLLAETGLSGFLAFAAFVGSVLGGPLRTLVGAGRRANSLPATCALLAGLGTVGLAGFTINVENYRGLWAGLALAEAYSRLHLRAEAFD